MLPWLILSSNAQEARSSGDPDTYLPVGTSREKVPELQGIHMEPPTSDTREMDLGAGASDVSSNYCIAGSGVK